MDEEKFATPRCDALTRQQAYDAECRRKDYLEIKRLVREYEVDDVIEMAKEAHEELKKPDDISERAHNCPRGEWR